LADKEDLHELLKAKIQTDIDYEKMPENLDQLTTIVELADVSKVIRHSTRLSGALMLICGLLMAGFGFYFLKPSSKMGRARS
jgi:hypothetical protein